ncbi:hypothetical protein K3495_g11526 [Podosphaera aphanis]|nr:hypothetical protein K3495_g11526 [Podosphaera aphanis]
MPANDHILEGGTDRQPHYYHTRRLTPAITEPYHRTTSVPTHPSIGIPAGSNSVGNSVILQRNNNNGRRSNYQRRGVASARGQQNLDLTSSQSLDTQVPNAPSTVHSFNRGGRSRKWRGRGAPGSRGGAQSGANGGRAFGEQLTIDINQGTNHNLIEGIRESSRGRSTTLQSGPHTGAIPRQRASKSDAPDLTTRIHKDIMNGQYECVICTNEVLPNSKIWACEICWSVLHLSCVKRWFSNDASMDQSRSNENEESKPSRHWRCPGCNSPKGPLQKLYTCWCSKEIEPRSIAGLPPHSCGQTCAKPRASECPHPSVFDEISCACGRTVLQPPQPCGTNAPNCKFDCHRQPRCGHPKVKHSCHQDSEACPKCPFLVEKLCICGKKSLKNQPCWFSEARCGLACGKKLKCGIHFCQKLCHRDGLCEDSSRPCTQLCGRKREVCGHACSNQCHAPYPCKEDEACIAKTFITCPCQNQKQSAKCLSSKTSAGSSDKKLTCNDDCLKAQRKAKLANALKIDPLTHEDGHVPYSTATLNIYTKNQEFAKKYEHDLRAFASDVKKKVLRFKPMSAHHRSFIHSLATDFGLDSESQDAEPYRFVSIFKTPRFVSAPLKTLSQCSQVKPNPIETVPVVAAMTPLTQGAKLWNAFLLVAPRFGLTIDEIKIALEPEFVKSNFELEISFIPSGDVTLCAVSSQPWSKTDEFVLESKTLTITTITKTYDLAASATLCAVDGHLNVLRRQDQSSASPGGWNQVAKRGSQSKRVLQQGVGRASSFAVLGKARKERDHKIIEDAPDDWEKEVDGWA